MVEKEKVFSEIVLNNFRREKTIYSRYACKSNKGTRKYPEREAAARSGACFCAFSCEHSLSVGRPSLLRPDG